MAVTQKESDQFQYPFYGLVLDMEATRKPNFKSIKPSQWELVVRSDGITVKLRTTAPFNLKFGKCAKKVGRTVSERGCKINK